MPHPDDTPPDDTESGPRIETDPPPDATPGESNPDERYLVWALVVMAFLAIFVWPVLGHEVPSGTVAALITAITTVFIARKRGSS